MAKKAKIKRCIDCPHCLDICPDLNKSDYLCTYNQPENVKLDNPLEIPDWCPLEDW
jgi:hypothetical protein